MNDYKDIIRYVMESPIAITTLAGAIPILILSFYRAYFDFKKNRELREIKSGGLERKV